LLKVQQVLEQTRLHLLVVVLVAVHLFFPEEMVGLVEVVQQGLLEDRGTRHRLAQVKEVEVEQVVDQALDFLAQEAVEQVLLVPMVQPQQAVMVVTELHRQFQVRQ
jgi:hypothetical protein